MKSADNSFDKHRCVLVRTALSRRVVREITHPTCADA